MQSWLNQIISGIIPEIAAILVPVVLAILSRRLSIVLSSLILALASVCILLAPAKAAEIIAISFYFGSVIIAASGFVAHRKADALQTQIDQLRQDVNSLSIASGRRFVKELNEDKERIIAARRPPAPVTRTQSRPAA